ncbi:MAG: hypothetical protein FWC33_01605 [Candidatus Bathyarchaeota archaeon]|nr:hypothetical protein [Candidatus Termiticorpusculum sp.]
MKDRRIEQEVDQIRLEIYEETKDLTHKQYNERVRKIGEEAAKKYGFQRVANTKENKILMTQER